MKQTFLTLLFLLAFFNYCSAQNIKPPFLISSGSTFTFLNRPTFSWSIGEIAVTELKNGLNITQGFYQAYSFKSKVINLGTDKKISFYPNPVIENFCIEHEYSDGLQVEVIDVTGKKITNFKNVKTKEILSLGEIKSGTYFIKFFVNDRFYHIAKVIKL